MDLAADARRIAMHLSAAAAVANRQVQTLLALPPVVLAEWLNSRGKDAAGMFAAHAEVGTALNVAAAAVEHILGAAAPPMVRVDVRPFAEKLASRGLRLVMSDTGAVILPLEPASSDEAEVEADVDEVVSVGPAPTPPEAPNDD
jgi:hypothetical protein